MIKQFFKNLEDADIVEVIKSNGFATLAAIVVIIPQTVHTFRAFMLSELAFDVVPNFMSITSAIFSGISGAIFALGLDMSILFFTLRNKTKIVWGTTAIIAIINFYVAWKIHRDFTVDFMASAFLGVIAPLIMAFYADTIIGKKRAK